ncbi:MAG TPA: hypothetical protein VMT57_00555 [Candidatus Thermoplasmatota archaeon]|nr:hypothetical protein [Candidatus Thermoplasmatota archaeon]
MDKKEEIKLIEGSRYKIISIGGRDSSLETEGIFKGYMSIGIEEAGILIEMGDSHGADKGKFRIVPLHAILAIDILDEKQHEESGDERESAQYYG